MAGAAIGDDVAGGCAAESRQLIDDRLGIGRGEAECLAIGTKGRRSVVPAVRRQPLRIAAGCSSPATDATRPRRVAATVSFSVATKTIDCPSGAHTAASASPPKPARAAAGDAPKRLRAFRLPSTSTSQKWRFRFLDPVIEIPNRERVVDADLRLRCSCDPARLCDWTLRRSHRATSPLGTGSSFHRDSSVACSRRSALRLRAGPHHPARHRARRSGRPRLRHASQQTRCA